MDNATSTFAELYLPLILGICCIGALCRSFGGERRIVTKLKPFGDFVDFHLEISNVLLVRALLVFGVFASISPYLFYDYSALFRRDYQMEVFFDERGIDQSLSILSPAERQRLAIPADLQKYQEQYFRQLDEAIKRTFGNRTEFFEVKEGYVHSVGHAQIIPEKVGSWQNYYVALSDGELTHILEVPNKPPQQFYTRFEKLPSKDDYISLSLSDLFVRRYVILRTQYKQILVQNNMSEGFVFKLTVVGITKLTVFPWPRVSNTVYLADFGNAGLVPIAYAIYR